MQFTKDNCFLILGWHQWTTTTTSRAKLSSDCIILTALKQSQCIKELSKFLNSLSWLKLSHLTKDWLGTGKEWDLNFIRKTHELCHKNSRHAEFVINWLTVHLSFNGLKTLS